MTTLLSSVISLQLCTCPSASIGNLPIYPFRYHCYFGHRIAYERVQDALLPSFASHGSISSISLFHIIKKTFGRYAKFHGHFLKQDSQAFLSDYSCVVLRAVYCGGRNYHLPHHYHPSGLPAISPMARLSKKINIRNVSKHVVTHI